jgi:hypothetical protein
VFNESSKNPRLKNSNVWFDSASQNRQFALRDSTITKRDHAVDSVLDWLVDDDGDTSVLLSRVVLVIISTVLARTCRRATLQLDSVRTALDCAASVAVNNPLVQPDASNLQRGHFTVINIGQETIAASHNDLCTTRSLAHHAHFVS